MKTISRAGEILDLTQVRMLPAPDDLEWTTEHLYEQLFAIGWVQSIFDEVAQNLCRHLETVSEGRRNGEDIGDGIV